MDRKMLRSRPSTLMQSFTNRTRDPKKTNSINIPKTDEINFNDFEIQQLKNDIEDLKKVTIQIVEENVLLKNDISSLKSELTDLKLLLPKRKGVFFRLQQSLKNRPSEQTLIEKKIIKNELCFNNQLENIPKDDIIKDVPKVLAECIRQLESNILFMNTEGLYRVSGNHSLVQRIRYKINSNNYKILKEQNDPHTFTGVIKLFLRELKRPLISIDNIINNINVDIFLKSNDDNRLLQIKYMITFLDTEYKITLKFLMQHLQRIADNPNNLMDAYSLSLVMAPCIFYETMNELKYLQNACIHSVTHLIIKYLIIACDNIFNNNSSTPILSSSTPSIGITSSTPVQTTISTSGTQSTSSFSKLFPLKNSN